MDIDGTDGYFEQMILRNNWVILDTETTGLEYPAEICQIAILNHDGKVLHYELVHPIGTIPDSATRIHGITNEQVKEARIWRDVWPIIRGILAGKDLIIYNYGYDTKLMRWSCKLSGCVYDEPWKEGFCAMEWYADLWGEYDEYHGTNRWQQLSKAAQQQKVKVESAHDALADCQMVLGLVNKLARKMGTV